MLYQKDRTDIKVPVKNIEADITQRCISIKQPALLVIQEAILLLKRYRVATEMLCLTNMQMSPTNMPILTLINLN